MIIRWRVITARLAALLTLVAVALIPRSISAAPSSIPVLSLACNPGSGTQVSCALSGHGFSAHEALQIVYQEAHGDGPLRDTYRRSGQTDAQGAFSRPPLVVALPANTLLRVVVHSHRQKYAATVQMYRKRTATVNWRCGQRSGGNVSCQLQGQGFRAGQQLTVVYGWTLGNMGNRPSHGSVARQTRADAHGAFTRPAVLLPVAPCYVITVDVIAGTMRHGTLLNQLGDMLGQPNPAARCG